MLVRDEGKGMLIRSYRRSKETNVPRWARFFNPIQYQCFLRFLRSYGIERRIKMEIDANWGECTIHDTKAKIGFSLHELAKRCKKFPLHIWIDIIANYMDENRAFVQSLTIICPECQSIA